MIIIFPLPPSLLRLPFLRLVPCPPPSASCWRVQPASRPAHGKIDDEAGGVAEGGLGRDCAQCVGPEQQNIFCAQARLASGSEDDPSLGAEGVDDEQEGHGADDNRCPDCLLPPLSIRHHVPTEARHEERGGADLGGGGGRKEGGQEGRRMGGRLTTMTRHLPVEKRMPVRESSKQTKE
jgi:hypothetical protein